MQQRTSRLISGFQHERICTSNQCPRLISYCACPVNHCWISRAKSQTEPHKAISDYTQARRETLSNCSASCGESQVTHKLLNRRARFLSACSEESCFDPARKAAAFASPDRKATNRASTSSQPIRFLSPRPLHGDFSPFVTLNVWAEKQLSGSFGKERNQKPGFTHPSHCLTYCPFRCPLAWAPSWSGWRGTSSARILPPIASWHVPVMQVHDSLWQRVLGGSCWGGARGRSRGREPNPCEQKARRSRTASRKMSALWVT